MQNYTADATIGKGNGILISREFANRDKNPHTHEFIEIIYILSGKGVEIVDGVEYQVERGDMLFINFGEEHAFKNSDMEFVQVLLRPEFMSERLVSSENIFDIFSLPQFSSISADHSKCIVSFSGEEKTAVSSAILTMLHEYEQKRDGYRAILYGYMQVIFTMLIRKLGQNCDAKCAQTVEKYIAEHLFERITLTDIAQNCFYNPSYFSRKFKHIFGKNLVHYLRERRLVEAARLLCTEDTPTDEIATRCAFSSKSAFYKLFKETYGVTPREYREGKKMT